MGCVCSSFHLGEPGEEDNISNECFVNTLWSKCAALFNKNETSEDSASNDGSTNRSIQRISTTQKRTLIKINELVSRLDNSESQTMPITQKDKTKDVYIHGSLDEDDICPICLEEYTLESPRTLTDCKHHYHLHCIYQWMEKSEVCPFCCKMKVNNHFHMHNQWRKQRYDEMVGVGKVVEGLDGNKLAREGKHGSHDRHEENHHA